MSSQAGDHTALLDELVKVLGQNKSLTDVDCSFPLDMEPAKLSFCAKALLRNALNAECASRKSC